CRLVEQVQRVRRGGDQRDTAELVEGVRVIAGVPDVDDRLEGRRRGRRGRRHDDGDVLGRGQGVRVHEVAAVGARRRAAGRGRGARQVAVGRVRRVARRGGHVVGEGEGDGGGARVAGRRGRNRRQHRVEREGALAAVADVVVGV